MSFFGCRPIQENLQKSPLPEEKVDSTLIELPLNAESFTQPEDSNLLDLVDQTQEETAGTSSVDLE